MFDYDGSFIRKFGKCGAGEGELWGPEGLAIDSANNFVQVFAADGSFITAFGKGACPRPRCVCIAPDGRILVVADGRVRLFASRSSAHVLMMRPLACVTVVEAETFVHSFPCE